jgi:Flp pilus assembly protein TadB
VVVELATQGTTFFHGAHELVSAAVKIDGFCMSEAGLSVRGDLRNNRKPQPAKTVLPNKHSMNALIVFLAALNVLIWGHNVVMIAGIIASMLVNAFSS